MNKLAEALTNANIPVPSKDTETFKSYAGDATIVTGLRSSMEGTFW